MNSVPSSIPLMCEECKVENANTLWRGYVPLCTDCYVKAYNLESK